MVKSYVGVITSLTFYPILQVTAHATWLLLRAHSCLRRGYSEWLKQSAGLLEHKHGHTSPRLPRESY